MAGICAGSGLVTDSNGYLAVQGPRVGSFPAGCDLATENGLRADPGTGSLWVAPPPTARTSVSPAAGTAFVYPTGPGVYPIAGALASQAATAPGCSPSYARVSLTGGMVTLRASSSNLWLIERQLSVVVGGVPVEVIAWQTVAEIDTPDSLAGGVLGTGHPPDTWSTLVQVAAGSTVVASVEYRLTVSEWHTHIGNRVDFRPPRLRVELVTVPLTIL